MSFQDLVDDFSWPKVPVFKWPLTAVILLGIFLIFPNWVFLLYIFAGMWAFHRQVLREEASLKEIYGEEYIEYCKRVRRYLQHLCSFNSLMASIML